MEISWISGKHVEVLFTWSTVVVTCYIVFPDGSLSELCFYFLLMEIYMLELIMIDVLISAWAEEITFSFSLIKIEGKKFHLNCLK